MLVKDSSNQWQPARAALDTCSQPSIISLSCVKRLGLPMKKTSESLIGIGENSAASRGRVVLKAASRMDKKFQIDFPALVIPEMNYILPSQEIPNQTRQKFSKLPLADPFFHVPRNIDILLNVEMFCELIKNNDECLIYGKPSALKTAFGWVIMGKSELPAGEGSLALVSVKESNTLECILQKFWQIEQVEEKSYTDPDEEFCEAHFKATVKKIKGRYSVSLPWRKEAPPLGDNRKKALQQYYRLEKNLGEHRESYHAFMEDYKEQGHMRKAAQTSAYVIPQLLVLRPGSGTTKLRTVFHASALDHTGRSLNDRLLPGPKLHSDVPALLLGFRFYKIVITADGKQFYRQIWVNEEDVGCQHIFYRASPNDEIEEYELCTVTYGVTPSAYQAQRVLIKLVEDEGHKFPLAAKAVIRRRFMDDFLMGAESKEEAIQLIEELEKLLALGGFQLRKWATNLPELLEFVPADHRESPISFSEESEVFKVLGLFWDAKTDSFHYEVQPWEGTPTKRNILSFLARLFDPMGYLAPVTFWVKRFFQKICESKLEWDAPLCGDLLQDWEAFIKDLPELSKFQVPRKIPYFGYARELIGFADGSEKGYAACVYLRIQVESSYESVLLRARTRVTPQGKKLTIPRVELLGALLLSELVEWTLRQEPEIASRVSLFTDSKIVLAWLKIGKHKLEAFVANRINKIEELVPSANWYHTISRENAADAPSRGMMPSTFVKFSPEWLNGPSFIREEKFPEQNQEGEVSLVGIPGIKKVSLPVVVAEEDEMIKWFQRFSSLGKLVRVFSYVLRWKKGAKHDTKVPSCAEQNAALLKIAEIVQKHTMREEIDKLLEKKKVSKGMRKFSPYLDEGLIRVGGRLPIHPVLLPKNCHLSELLCRHYHVISGHSGTGLVRGLINRKFWIMGAKAVLDRISKGCVKCVRVRAVCEQPPMAPLPQDRITPARPFSVCCTDFAGPFWVKEGRRRNAPKSKGYLCVFVCFAVKAVHLEFVSALATQAFMAALDRFVARRSCPNKIYSDNGTNYVGAARQLKEVTQFLREQEDEITVELAKREISWKFQPPNAPHFGGLHEAAVKSAKRLFTKMMGEEALFFEEYCTVFSRIEAILNSRPLGSGPEDVSQDGGYLSPGHFLVGVPLLAAPEVAVPEGVSLRCRWARLRQMTQAFWRRWSAEYYQSLIARTKWTAPARNLEVGDLVVVPDHRNPMSWPMARVVQVFPGQDGVVRVVQLKLGSGVFKRAARALVKLPG